MGVEAEGSTDGVKEGRTTGYEGVVEKGRRRGRKGKEYQESQEQIKKGGGAGRKRDEEGEERRGRAERGHYKLA